MNLTRNPALFLLAQNSTDQACPTKADVPLHYSGRSIASKTAGAIRYRLPLPMNAEGDMVLVISMLARAAKNGSSDDVHAMISVGGGTPQLESLNPGTLLEAYQAWIPRGGGPEEFAVHLRVAQPAWQWPDFVPGTLTVSQGSSGEQLATSEFYNSLFLEVRTVTAVVLTTLQVFSGTSVPVAASGEASTLAGSSAEQPASWTVPGLGLDRLALSASALVLCAIVAMLALEQHSTNTTLSQHADGKGNVFAALRQWLEQQVEPAPRKPTGFTDEELLQEELAAQKSSKIPRKSAPKTGAGRSSRKATESKPPALAAASEGGNQNKDPAVRAAPRESAKADVARQAGSKADAPQTKTKPPQATQPKLAKPDHVAEDTWAALPLELQKELAGSYPASWSPDLGDVPSRTNETRSDKRKHKRDQEQQKQEKKQEKHWQEQRQKHTQEKQEEEQQQKKKQQNQPQQPQEQRPTTKEVQVEPKKEKDAATKKESTEKEKTVHPSSHAEQQPQQQPQQQRH